MNKQAPTKQIDDYEPISGGAVCIAVASTLGISLLLGAFSSSTTKEVLSVPAMPKKITTQDKIKLPINSGERARN